MNCKLNCKNILQLLELKFWGSQVLIPEQRKEIIEHLKGCPQCLIYAATQFAAAKVIGTCSRTKEASHYSRYEIAETLMPGTFSEEAIHDHIHGCPVCQGVYDELNVAKERERERFSKNFEQEV